MRKLSTLTLALILALSGLTACSSGDQGPFKEGTISDPNSTRPGYIPNGGDRPFNPRPGTGELIGPLGPVNGGVTNPMRDTTLPNIDWDNPPADMVVVTVYFDFDQFNIQPDDRKLLEAAAKTLAGDPSMRVVAVGHCDHFGSEQYNLALGDRRSNAVKAYLTRNGAEAAQTEVLSRGNFGASPTATKNSPEAKHDRRVDVIKIPVGAVLPSGPPPSTVPVTAAP